MLERIVYVSRAAAGVGPEQVNAIIRAAHARNGAQGLSGALIFLDGWFAQLIEGPSAPVDAAFARVAADPRHERLGLRIRAPALARVLPGQAMALRHRGCLAAGLLADFDYRPGFPVATFPVDVLTEFVIRACRQRAAEVQAAEIQPAVGSHGWTSVQGLSGGPGFLHDFPYGLLNQRLSPYAT